MHDFTSLLAKIALLGLTKSLSSPRKFPKYVTFITSRDWLPPLHWGRNCHLCHLTIQRKKFQLQGLVPTDLEGLREVARDSNKSTHREILAGARSTQFQTSGLKTSTILGCRNMLLLAEKFCLRNPPCPWLVTAWPQHLQIRQGGFDVNSVMSWHKSPLPCYFLSYFYILAYLLPAWIISEHQPIAAQGNATLGADLFCNPAFIWCCGVPFTSESNIWVPQALQGEWERMNWTLRGSKQQGWQRQMEEQGTKSLGKVVCKVWRSSRGIERKMLWRRQNLGKDVGV